MTDLTRQLDIFDPSAITDEIVIVGAGGIGSAIAWLLAKMGVRHIRIIDFDTVEPHNIPNQLPYDNEDIGKPKVEALLERLKEHGAEVAVEMRRVEPGERFSGIVIMAVDSITMRKMLYENIRASGYGVRLAIDVRMGGTEGQVFAFDPRDPDEAKAYEETLFSESEAAQESCTAQAILFTPMIIAAVVGRLIADYAKLKRFEGGYMIELGLTALDSMSVLIEKLINQKPQKGG